MNYLTLLDYRVFAFMNSWAGIHPWFDGLIIFLAHYLIWIVIPAAFLYPVLSKDKIKITYAWLFMGISFVIARGVVTELIRHFLYRSRPFITHTVAQLINKPSVASFPSGHTVAIVSIGAGLYWYNKKAGIAVMVLGIVVGISRIIAGVHYPTDVIVSIIIGIITGYCAGSLVKILPPTLSSRYKDWIIRVKL